MFQILFVICLGLSQLRVFFVLHIAKMLAIIQLIQCNNNRLLLLEHLEHVCIEALLYVTREYCTCCYRADTCAHAWALARCRFRKPMFSECANLRETQITGIASRKDNTIHADKTRRRDTMRS